jgi:hypothetical protein
LNSSVLTRCLKVDTLGCAQVLGMATRYDLDSAEFETWWGARFSLPFYAVPDSQPASCSILPATFPAAEAAIEWR